MNLSSWEVAYRTGRRAFYESATDTIRACPENYCLAIRVNGEWQAYRDEGATRRFHDVIQALVETIEGAPSDDALADEIGTLLGVSVAGLACRHNEMVPNDDPERVWKCALCGYVYGAS